MKIEKIQFEAGTGKHFDGVNLLRGEADGYSIYAEVKVPEGASEDYGYIAMKKAILEKLPELKADFWYDGQEQFLAEDADVDCEVYLDIEKLDDGAEEDVTTDIEEKYTRWYAVMENEDDDDWGWGSHDYHEALEMLKKQGCGLIAFIDIDSNNIADCVDERRYEDFDWED